MNNVSDKNYGRAPAECNTILKNKTIICLQIYCIENTDHSFFLIKIMRQAFILL